MSNENKNTLEEYIAPAKSAAEIRAERAAAAAAKVKAEAEAKAKAEAEARAKEEAEQAALRAAEEQQQRKRDVEEALKHFDEETQYDAVLARRKAREMARKRIEAELQAEAQATALTPHERRKLEKKAAKGDEVARSQLMAADAVQRKARERLAEFDASEFDATQVIEPGCRLMKIPFITGRNSSSAVAKRVLLIPLTNTSDSMVTSLFSSDNSCVLG